MKVDTFIHNEKKNSEGKSNGIKTLKTKLMLNKETIRDLRNLDLKRVVGGGHTSRCTLDEGCGSSDIRLKTNIRAIDNALETVLSLKGFKYEWKKDDSGLPVSEGAPLGFLAQDVEKVLPEVVTTHSNGYKAIFYQNITAVLVEAMKQQQVIIDQQRAELSRLGAELEQMKTFVQKLDVLVQSKAQAAGHF